MTTLKLTDKTKEVLLGALDTAISAYEQDAIKMRKAIEDGHYTPGYERIAVAFDAMALNARALRDQIDPPAKPPRLRKPRR